MATWGSHFRIAENILNKYPNLNRKFFAIGNIAPDCGLPNDNWSAFTPPKEVSHFTVDNTSDFLEIKTDKFILSDIEFYFKYLKDFQINSSKDGDSLLFGYFIHLITDNLWNYYIMQPLKEKHLRDLQKKPDFIWEVKRDWYDLDKIFITENKDSLFWTDFLKAEYNEDLLNFFPREGVRRQLKFIKKFYQISKEEYQRISKKEFIYLNRNQMDNFVQNSTDVILKVIAKIFEKELNFTEKISVLDGILIWD